MVLVVGDGDRDYQLVCARRKRDWQVGMSKCITIAHIDRRVTQPHAEEREREREKFGQYLKLGNFHSLPANNYTSSNVPAVLVCVELHGVFCQGTKTRDVHTFHSFCLICRKAHGVERLAEC